MVRAEDLHPVDDHLLVGEDADTLPFRRFQMLPAIEEFLVISGDEIEAERQGKLRRGSGQAMGVGGRAVVQVADDEMERITSRPRLPLLR